ncbi:MAG: Y4jG [bacterium]|nr:Y4jG [bacterium]
MSAPHSRPQPSSASGFLDLEELVVPRRLADAGQAHLRTVGRCGNEGFALWIGRRTGRTFHVDETVIPEQRGLQFDSGVCVTVGNEELFRINKYLYATGRQLVAQIHSHPTVAYHSETDDTYPIATTAGAFSLVIPDFATRPFSLDECAVYRLVPHEGWLAFPIPAVHRVIRLTDD